MQRDPTKPELEHTDLMVKLFPVALRKTISELADQHDTTMRLLFIDGMTAYCRQLAGLKVEPPSLARPGAPVVPVDKDAATRAVVAVAELVKSFSECAAYNLPVSKVALAQAQRTARTALREIAGEPALVPRKPRMRLEGRAS